MKSSVLLAMYLLGIVIADIDPVVIKGSKFFYSSNNTQFYIRGIAYQQDYQGTSPSNASDKFRDPLADPVSCKRDIPILKELNTNTIRVYAINPHSSHDECMRMLADAGIYVISDLSDPTHSIDRVTPNWQAGLYSRYVNVIDEMAQFDNTLGFFAGNEVANSVSTTNSSAFVKAAVRDMKAHIRNKKYRPMGVGYSTSDDAEIRINMANYFNCDSPDDGVDFWGYNVYSWCGDSSYENSGYRDRTDEFRNYSVPVFFAEYGCNAVQPRKFTEIDALYSDPMDQVWSGGIIYMYFQEVNNYGLVSVVNDNSVNKLVDFGAYSQRIGSANPSGINKDSYTESNTALQACPTLDRKWAAAATPLPPTPHPDFCDCMTDAAGCVVADSVPSSSYGDLFNVVCGSTDCSDIVTDSTAGEYGNYSMCEPRQQLSIMLNKYYEEKGSDSSACHFDGYAVTKVASRSRNDCKIVADKKVTNGTKTVSSEESDSSSSSPCSCTCLCMGMDSLNETRSKVGASSAAANLRLSVGIESFEFGLSVGVALLTGMAIVFL